MTTPSNTRNFLDLIRRVAGKVPFARDIVAMYYAMLDPETPMWATVQIAAAIAYFVAPFDAFPDVLVPIGFTDDAAVVATCLAIVAMHVSAEHKRRASEFFDA